MWRGIWLSTMTRPNTQSPSALVMDPFGATTVRATSITSNYDQLGWASAPSKRDKKQEVCNRLKIKRKDKFRKRRLITQRMPSSWKDCSILWTLQIKPNKLKKWLLKRLQMGLSKSLINEFLCSLELVWVSQLEFQILEVLVLDYIANFRLTNCLILRLFSRFLISRRVQQLSWHFPKSSWQLTTSLLLVTDSSKSCKTKIFSWWTWHKTLTTWKLRLGFMSRSFYRHTATVDVRIALIVRNR